MDVKAFHAKIVRFSKDNVEGTALLVVREVNSRKLQEAYGRVKIDVERIVDEVRREAMDEQL